MSFKKSRGYKLRNWKNELHVNPEDLGQIVDFLIPALNPDLNEAQRKNTNQME